MEYFKPLQSNLYFIYNHVANNVSIRSHVTVWLPAGESLTITGEYDDVTKTARKIFDHAQNPSQLLPYEYVNETAVEFINHVDIPYDEHHQEEFKNALRETFADEYMVKAIVNDKPGQSGTGGEAQGALAKGEIIEIA